MESRHWEKPFSAIGSRPAPAATPAPAPDSLPPNTKILSRDELEKDRQREMEDMFKHGASPFRTHPDAPPKFSWTHAWGMMTWGKKAGAWGKGVEGLKERKDGDEVDGEEGKEAGEVKEKKRE